MKKLIILSDTHGNVKDLMRIADIIRESDCIIHLGDGYNDLNFIYEDIKDKLYRVHGNCDYGTQKEIVIEIEGLKIFATHGDLYGVKRGTGRLVDKAKEEGCQVALYGHTHRAEITECGGITVINPGSAERYKAGKSYCYAVINGDRITAVINEKAFG